LDVDSNGRTVKGVKFQGLRDIGDPVEMAITYEAQGADELVFLDISASHEGRKTLVDLVKRISHDLRIPFTVGGGISSLEQVLALLEAGADKVSINSSAVRNPQLIADIASHCGRQCCVLAIDAKRADHLLLSAHFAAPAGKEGRTYATAREAFACVALDHLRRNPWRRPDVAAIASEACVSRSTLENRFRTVIGRSLHEEFVRLRLAGLRRLITDTDLPLKAVAIRAGFPSVQYMTTFLHRHTGLTPARLRAVERRRGPAA
jgi:AraC-like DNA-binding protein